MSNKDEMTKLCQKLIEQIRNPDTHPVVKTAAGATLAQIFDPIIEAEEKWEADREDRALHGGRPKWIRKDDDCF